MTTAGGGRGGDVHKYEKSPLPFAGSKISRHLIHVDTKRAEAIEGLLVLLYDRVNGIVSMPDMARIYITLGGGAVGEGGGV